MFSMRLGNTSFRLWDIHFLISIYEWILWFIKLIVSLFSIMFWIIMLFSINLFYWLWWATEIEEAYCFIKTYHIKERQWLWLLLLLRLLMTFIILQASICRFSRTYILWRSKSLHLFCQTSIICKISVIDISLRF